MYKRLIKNRRVYECVDFRNIQHECFHFEETFASCSLHQVLVVSLLPRTLE